MQHLEAVVFDWAGTLIDFGSKAPMGAFVESFLEFGVHISVADARGPMGMAKLDHIMAIGQEPHIAAQWTAAQGGAFDEAAAERIYAVFVPKNAEIIADYADLIPGAIPTIQAIRAQGLKIGTTTGYTRDLMDRVLPLVKAQGFEPDSLICAMETYAGRPSPAMMYQTFLNLQITASAHAVKVDDTEVGILEGLSAGAWTVGIAGTGNVMGLSEAELNALTPEERDDRLDEAREIVAAWGCDYVIDSVAELMPVLEDIDEELDALGDPDAD